MEENSKEYNTGKTVPKSHPKNKSWKPECALSFNMNWRILVNFVPRFWLGIKY